MPHEEVSIVWKRRNHATECPTLGTAMARALAPVDEILLDAVTSVRRVVAACSAAKACVRDEPSEVHPTEAAKNNRARRLDFSGRGRHSPPHLR